MKDEKIKLKSFISQKTLSGLIVFLTIVSSSTLIFLTYQYIFNNLSNEFFLTNLIGLILSFSILFTGLEIVRQNELKISPQHFNITPENIFKSLWPFSKHLICAVIGTFLIFFTVLVMSYTIFSVTNVIPTDIKNGTNFLTLLEIVLGFIAIMGVGVYLWISRNINNRTQETFLENRRFTEIQTFKNTGYMHYNLFEIYSECKEEKKKNEDEGEEEEKKNEDGGNNLRRAIKATSMALSLSNDIDEKRNRKQICIIKNNLAWFLKEKWECIKNKRGGEDRLREYLEEKTSRNKYKGDSQSALDYIEYITNKKATPLYTKEEREEIIETHDKVKRTFNEIDELIGIIN